MSRTRIPTCWLALTTICLEPEVEREVHGAEAERAVLLHEVAAVDAAALHGQLAVVDDDQRKRRRRLVGAELAHVRDHVAPLVALALGRRADEVDGGVTAL